TRLELRRPHHRLRLHAGHGAGERPPRRLRLPRADRGRPGRLYATGLREWRYPAPHFTMRRFDSSSAISLKLSASVAPVAFQNSLAALAWLFGSLRNRESDAQARRASMAAACVELPALRSSATDMMMTPASLAFSHSAAMCSFIALV